MAFRRWLVRAAAAAGAGAAVGVGVVEARYRRHPGNDLSFRDEDWTSTRKAPDHLWLGGRLICHNEVRTREVTLADMGADVRLLSRLGIEDLRIDAKVL